MDVRPTRRRGSAAIEFALWLPVMLMFVAAIVDYGFYMTTRVSVARGAMEGVRVGATVFEPNSVVPPGSVVGVKARQRSIRVLNDLGIACPGTNCSVTASYCPAASAPCFAPFDAIEVQVNYTFEPLFGLVPVPTTMIEKQLMAVENQRSL
jgi:hypothetical protein